jgi:CubicO group peptidase (beta-lactamase class C family)
MILLVFLPAVQFIYGQQYQWETAVPEEEGFSSEKLYALRDTLAQKRTTSILVIRNGRIILEWYASGWDLNRKHYTASLSKALVGGMSLMLALDDRRLDIDDPVCKFIPEWRGDPLKSKITIRHLATHSSGIENAEMTDEEITELRSKGVKIEDRQMDLPGWKGNFWRHNPDPFTLSLDSAPVLFPPGSSFHYSNPGMAILSYCITSSYQGSNYKDIRELLSERIYIPAGLTINDWQIGYGKTYKVDNLDLVPNWGGGNMTPRAVARLGLLMLNCGKLGEKRLVDSGLVRFVTKYAGTPLPPRHAKEPAPGCALVWYTNFDGVWERAPRDLFLGSGAGNQTLIVIPSLKIIVVRNGENMFDYEKGEGHYYGVEQYLVNLLMDAFIDPPYPQSNLIKDVWFAPKEEIIRSAQGSDNWPITWGPGNTQYTAYGDGWGFEPHVEKKLSLGLAKITGCPENIKGVNLRSATGEYTGDGASGKKASGIVMIDGILYLWVRNANGRGEESLLKWSPDRGLTWKECDWRFAEGFGCPTFLNYGRNYKGARDNYVYIYSFDEKSAYKPSDWMVLARVPKNRVTERGEYEFFSHTDIEGNPVWEKEIGKRGPVFIHPAMCYRSGITFNAGLKRYLWCQVHPHSSHPQGPRFQGGFGIYEAEEPWGPWRTVYYTKAWDTGPGESSSFPFKLISRDGKTCWLLFSGEDSFALRKTMFILK